MEHIILTIENLWDSGIALYRFFHTLILNPPAATDKSIEDLVKIWGVVLSLISKTPLASFLLMMSLYPGLKYEDK